MVEIVEILSMIYFRLNLNFIRKNINDVFSLYVFIHNQVSYFVCFQRLVNVGKHGDHEEVWIIYLP